MDERFQRPGVDFRMVRLPTWKLWLLGAVGGAVILALAVTVAGLFLILFPIVLIAGFITRLLLGGGRKPGRPAPGMHGRTEVIEGHYEVVEVQPGRGWDRRPQD